MLWWGIYPELWPDPYWLDVFIAPVPLLGFCIRIIHRNKR
jgi:hypothetical protein